MKECLHASDDGDGKDVKEVKINIEAESGELA